MTHQRCGWLGLPQWTKSLDTVGAGLLERDILHADRLTFKGLFMQDFSLSRRQALLTAAIASVAASHPSSVWAAAALAQKQALGLYVTPVGDYQLTVLLDRTNPMPVDRLLVGAPPEHIRAWLGTRHRTVPVATSVNSYLINTGPELLLVDSGGGEFMGAGGAALLPTLQAAGYQTGQIDKVLLTHLHIDHIGGLSQDGRAVFENAELWVPKPELDYWFSDDARAQAPEAARAGFDRARSVLAPYQTAKRLQTFEWGDELAPGIRAVDLHGHTPGHTGFDVQRNGEHVRIWGDVVHVQDIQLDHPEIAISFDVDPETAKAQRLAALQDAADKGYRVAGSHMAFPGLGHVRRKGDAFEWIAETFSNQIK